MEYREFPPPHASSALVRCFWTLEGVATEGPADPVFPDGSPELIVNLGDPIDAHGPDSVAVAQPALMLVGQITRPFVIHPTGSIRLFGVRLEPFGGAAFCDDMSRITDQWANLRDLIGAAQLRRSPIEMRELPDGASLASRAGH